VVRVFGERKIIGKTILPGQNIKGKNRKERINQ